MKYVTKPFEINAVQFNGNWAEVAEFVGKRSFNGFRMSRLAPAEDYYLDPPEEIVAVVYDDLQSTWVGVKYTDYIIQGMKGEFYPCDAEVFEAKYKKKIGE
jgi:hypothetical protein